MTAITTMAVQLLPSFQSFLASAQLSPPSPIVYKHKPLARIASSDFEQRYYAHPAARMYQLASLTAREYERALRSPASSSIGSSSPTASDVSSDEESRVMRTASTAPRSVVAKSSKKKYLKEKQRCEIVRRVRAGEKQAHLAKEFGVSRAAVCYLLKHQTEILSRCGDDGNVYSSTVQAV